MISKLIKGRGARGLLDYLTGTHDHNGDLRELVQVLGGTMPGQTARDLAKGFAPLHAARPSLGVYITHAILSWDTAAGDAVDLDAQRDMMTCHMHDLGYEDFVIVSHGGHVHAAASRIRRDGSVVSDRWDWRTAEKSVRGLEVAYGLRRLQSSWEAPADAEEPKPRPFTAGEAGLLRKAISVASAAPPEGAQAAKLKYWDSLYSGTMPADLIEHLQYIDRDTRTVRLAGGSWVRDHGDRITIGAVTDVSVRLLIVEARAKGWPGIVFTGSDDFKQRAWLEAQRVGIPVSEYEPPKRVREAWEAEKASLQPTTLPILDEEGETPFDPPFDPLPIPEKPGRASAPDPAPPIKPELADMVLAARAAALADGGTVSAFIEHANRAGVEVRPNWSPVSGRVSGLSFFLADAPEVEVSGSKLSRSLSWAAMQKGGLSYEFERDGPRFSAAAERAEAIRSGGPPGRVEGPRDRDLGGPGGSVPADRGDGGRPVEGNGYQPQPGGGLAGPPGSDPQPPGVRHGAGSGADEGRGCGDGRGDGGAHGPDRGGSQQPGEGGVSPDAGDRGRREGDTAERPTRDRDDRQADRAADGPRVGPGGEGGNRAAGSSRGADRGGMAVRPGNVVDGDGNGDWIGPAYERVVAAGGVADARFQRTLVAARSAVAALGGEAFLIGIMPPRGTRNDPNLLPMNKNYTAAQAEAEITLKYLRAMNAKGYDIYFRPAGAPEGMRPPVILVDDLAPEAIDRMRAAGHEPCLIVSTSAPDRLQAWVRVGSEPIRAEVAREVARALATSYGGDMGAAKSEQYGRLPGFTNRKPIRIQQNGGKPPFAMVQGAAPGKVVSNAADLLAGAEQAIQAGLEAKRQAIAAASRRVAEDRREARQEAAGDAVYNAWVKSSRGPSGGNLSAVDFAAASAGFRAGHNSAEIIEALRQVSPDLEQRHSNADAYLARTVAAAAAANTGHIQQPRGHSGPAYKPRG